MNGVRPRRWSSGALAAALVTLAVAQAQAQPTDPHAGHHHGAAASQPPADDMAGMAMGSMKGMDMGATHPPPPRASSDLPTSVSIADGVTLRSSASAIALSFAHPVVLTAIVLTNAAGQRFPFNATLTPTLVATVSASTLRLPPGTYRIVWRTLDGGERGSGARDFTIA